MSSKLNFKQLEALGQILLFFGHDKGHISKYVLIMQKYYDEQVARKDQRGVQVPGRRFLSSKKPKKVNFEDLFRPNPLACEHANENPSLCCCPYDCYCKSHTCFGIEVPTTFTIDFKPDGPHKRLVILESPYAPSDCFTLLDNLNYARECVSDSLRREEAPFASHLLYTQYGILDDTVPDERALGIAAGHAWIARADATVVYMDHGLSSGMEEGIHVASLMRIPIEFRRLDD